MLPRLNVSEVIEAGRIVGITNGKVTQQTAGAGRLMVVSDRAAFVGNMQPNEEEEALFETVAFIGQVPTWVEGFALDAAYPNPASGPATIGYALPEAADVTLAVYDVLGRRVATLVNGQQAAGRHEAVLDTKRLSSGMYVYRLTAGQQTQTRRLLLVR